MSTCPVVGSTVDTSATPPLYDRVGGRDAVAAVVELLYKKILADDGLNSFFTRTDMKRLKRHQVEFISAAFGHGRSDAKIVAAHAKLKGLQMQHFDAVASHLSDSLSELEVPQDLIAEVLATVGTLRPQFEKAVQLAN